MSSAEQFIELARPDLGELLEYWQRVLNIQDYGVKVEWKRWHEMGIIESYGTCRVDMQNKMALIEIREPIDALPSDVELYGWDPERILVHELLHIVLWPLTDEDEEGKKSLPLEQSINALSRALVRLRYTELEKGKKKTK